MKVLGSASCVSVEQPSGARFRDKARRRRIDSRWYLE